MFCDGTGLRNVLPYTDCSSDNISATRPDRRAKKAKKSNRVRTRTQRLDNAQRNGGFNYNVADNSDSTIDCDAVFNKMVEQRKKAERRDYLGRKCRPDPFAWEAEQTRLR